MNCFSTLIPIYLITFFSTAAFSAIAPIFPNKAASKGLSSSMAGIVFSIFGISNMITSAPTGKLLPKFGAEMIYIFGLVLIGLSNIAFGFLIYVNDYSIFLIACFATRMFEGIAVGLLGPFSFFIVVRQTNVIGNLEVMTSTGFTLGFLFGGFIYSIFGFTVPFVILGSLLLLNVPFCVLSIDKLLVYDSYTE
ncbi:MFS-type transporter SLC18B1-like protein [Leptotrombidium deliense]|uniref:MFS-type transporter SLC18B1-like protein n=1 Tax=Leptotrombidium deliense TaxID=299467 RepID=A0A443RXB4_9ACAR|nr:MFS-type transporter SLC18B1-like protein [Leptotrombidium deliense]